MSQYNTSVDEVIVYGLIGQDISIGHHAENESNAHMTCTAGAAGQTAWW